jgi:tetratricopeptide (TPR) repeat protein
MKKQLVEILERTRGEIRTFVASLSVEECAAVGTVDHWAAKDIINHSSGWTKLLAQNLEAAGRGDPITVYDDYLAHNDVMFEECRDCSWEDTLAVIDKTWEKLVDFIQAATEEDLQDTEKLSTQNGRPLWRMICGTACEHTVMHLAYYLIEKGRGERATALYESFSQALAKLDETPAWQGLLQYNRACIYALGGEKEKAVAYLKEGLSLQPQLVEWSKQDADLLPLHGYADYEALYQG